jgi:hypothetical protein
MEVSMTMRRSLKLFRKLSTTSCFENGIKKLVGEADCCGQLSVCRSGDRPARAILKRIAMTGSLGKFSWSKSNNHDARHHDQDPTQHRPPDQVLYLPKSPLGP